MSTSRLTADDKYEIAACITNMALFADLHEWENFTALYEPKLLVDECKTELAELSRREWQPHRLAVDLELAVLRLVEAGEDLDQGRLPRTVLPEQAVDLPGENAQVDAAQRSGPAEALRQVAESQARLPGAAHGYFRPQSFW